MTMTEAVFEGLVRAWQQATAGEQRARSSWREVQGGSWRWDSDGLTAVGTGTEWASLAFGTGPSSGGPVAAADVGLLEQSNWVIELDVAGRAGAAGISFGHFKDFLVDLRAKDRCRLQLEADVSTGRWSFRADGQLQPRNWWDADVKDVTSLRADDFTFKARHLKEVRFERLALHTFSAACRLSVIITCHRFLQRLRITLRNWCNQTLPGGMLEVLIVNPASPDGTHEHLSAVARSYPHLRICELAVPANLATNKSAMINRAVRQARGQWIWLTDADCLFPPDAAARTLEFIDGRDPRLFHGQRRYLTSAQTDALLSGRLDGLRDFDALAAAAETRPPENAPWGYTQIVPRPIMKRILYRESIRYFAHSDNLFIQDCRRNGIRPEQIDGLFCLHLDHPFSWYGTDTYL